ncbi:hypothetical protein Dxin01_02873 [Deinococcus xinjiangensis]|uniref:Uncharacterized protein n=1 Tax=Deinococcus xinjiangensis TaxID=457454 RepID=A0ABP9VD03_9DEIO
MNPTTKYANRADSPHALPDSGPDARLGENTSSRTMYRFRVYDEQGRFMGSASSQSAGKHRGWHTIVDTVDGTQLVAKRSPESTGPKRIKLDLSERAAALVLNALFLASDHEAVTNAARSLYGRAHNEVLRQGMEQGGISLDAAFMEDPI